MSNYEWQKQYTKQRIESRLRDAELHRLAAEGPSAPRLNPLAAVLRLITGLFPARRRLTDPTLFHSESRVKGRSTG